ERAIERRLEQVRVVEVDDVGAPDDPEPDALLATPEQLPGVMGGQDRVGRHDAPAVAHRVAVLLLSEHLTRCPARLRWSHAAAGAARIASRTRGVSARASRRKASRA